MSRFGPINAEEVKERRRKTGEGMLTAKLEIERENVLRTVQHIREGIGSDGEVADVLEWLVNKARIG